MRTPRSSQRGGAMVEFPLTAMLLLTVVFASFEFDRMLMVYTSLANAARTGVRYAIVHGSNRTLVGSPASGASDYTNITRIVRGFAKTSILDPSLLNISVQYPGSGPGVEGNTPGSIVIVTVSYPYNPFTFIPVTPTLRASSRGVVVF